jgi:hypothetical protein
LAHELSFSELHRYDLRKVGISVPVWLRRGSKIVNIEAKVDTGATYCVFRRAIGDLLGLDMESGQPQLMSTPTGAFDTYGHEVEMKTLGMEMRAVVYFAADERFNRDVVGQIGWLDRLRIGIVHHDGLLYLGHHNDLS